MINIPNSILNECKRNNIRILTINDSDYPERLRNIYDPPKVLYLKGILPNIDDEPIVAVVGTRNCTPYGMRNTEKICYELSKNGMIVSTGLALGIDTAAVQGGLKGGRPVIAVIGTGVDVPYPTRNKQLYKEIIKNGVIISEYPPGTPALPHHFPQRNRIVSGISLGVAVIEAPAKSGALITTDRALEQGRDIFALPGNIDLKTCEGSNMLLRQGAIPFMSADDIIDEYIDMYSDKLTKTYPRETIYVKKQFDNRQAVDYIDKGSILEKIIFNLDGDEKNIVSTIGEFNLHIDDIILSTGLETQKVSAALTMLELNGYIVKDQSGKWEIKHPG
jgi:DNA processing protein